MFAVPLACTEVAEVARADASGVPARAAGLAISPVVHGAAHASNGRGATAGRLLALEGGGLALAAVGGATFWLSGAARPLAGPATVAALSGASIFATSWLADVYGALTEGRPACAAEDPALTAELGYRYVYSAQFSYRHFTAVGAELRSSRVAVHPYGWFALGPGDAASRLRAEGSLRALAAEDDGSRLDVETAVTRFTIPSAGFRLHGGELALSGRLDMRRVGASLGGSFAELAVGSGLDVLDRASDGASGRADTSAVLLFRWAYGVWLGAQGDARRGEASLYYDHRHDDFAAGLTMRGVVSGVLGHFGASGKVFFAREWGLAFDAQVGSAYVAGVSLLHASGRATTADGATGAGR